jgi:beta-1,6-galactosyltransferase
VGQACGSPPYSFNLTRVPPKRRDAAVRGLRDWLGKQRFELQLVDLIKRPMDRYAAGARGG